MNPVHLHLVLNHVPVVGIPIALALALFGALRGNDSIERAGLVVLLALALLSAPAYLTGEPAEDALAGIPGVSGPHVEEHEEAAGFALGATLATGAASVVALSLARRRGRVPPAARVVVLVLALASAAALARTAWLGGMVHHPELRTGTTDRSP